MYKLVDGKIRFEYDKSKELDIFEESKKSKNEYKKISGIGSSFFGIPGMQGADGKSGINSSSWNAPPPDILIKTCNNCGYKMSYFSTTGNEKATCPQCKIKYSILDIPEVVGTLCNCNSCTKYKTNALLGNCPSCDTEHLQLYKNEMITCECGMKYKIVEYKSDQISQPCPSCHAVYQGKVKKWILCKCGIEYIMDWMYDVDGNKVLEYVQTYKSNKPMAHLEDIYKKLKTEYVCICGVILLGNVLEYVKCKCGKIYLVTEHHGWTQIGENKDKLLIEKTYKNTAYVCKCGYYMTGKVGDSIVCICGVEYQVMYKEWKNKKVKSYICKCNKILDGNVDSTVKCDCGKIYEVTDSGIWGEVTYKNIDYPIHKVTYHYTCPYCNVEMHGTWGSIIECNCPGLIQWHVNVLWILDKSVVYCGQCLWCKDNLTGYVGDKKTCQCQKTYTITNKWTML